MSHARWIGRDWISVTFFLSSKSDLLHHRSAPACLDFRFLKLWCSPLWSDSLHNRSRKATLHTSLSEVQRDEPVSPIACKKENLKPDRVFSPVHSRTNDQGKSSKDMTKWTYRGISLINRRMKRPRRAKDMKWSLLSLWWQPILQEVETNKPLMKSKAKKG